MTKGGRPTARKPATKFPQLQKKMQKQKLHANKAKSNLKPGPGKQKGG